MDQGLILLVDDDEDDREMFVEALGEVGSNFSFHSAEDGEQALRYLYNESNRLPDLIFLDMNMPRLNGRQCLEEMKKSPRLQPIPVVVYSTTKREEDVRETNRLGAVYFLTKPVLFDDITAAIDEMLNRFVKAKN